VTGRFKDELALEDTHTYNPPHRKRRPGRAEDYWLRISGARPNGQGMFQKDPRWLAWAIPRRCRRFSRKS